MCVCAWWVVERGENFDSTLDQYEVCVCGRRGRGGGRRRGRRGAGLGVFDLISSLCVNACKGGRRTSGWLSASTLLLFFLLFILIHTHHLFSSHSHSSLPAPFPPRPCSPCSSSTTPGSAAPPSSQPQWPKTSAGGPMGLPARHSAGYSGPGAG